MIVIRRVLVGVPIGGCAVACSKAPPEVDCAALLADPGSALTTLTEREADPAKGFGMLEQCRAPTGATCDRAAAGAAMDAEHGDR